jgi:hypothetical protein
MIVPGLWLLREVGGLNQERNMFTRQRWVVLLALIGCAGEPRRFGEEPRRPEETEDYGYLEGAKKQVWVRGPWDAIKPSQDIDEVIDQLCPAIMELPGARDRYYGREYCGAIYSLGDGVYYASRPSPLRETKPVEVGPVKEKSCYPPRVVRDPRRQVTPIIADFHGHPWAPSKMSVHDREISSQVWHIRIQFDTACHIQKLIPYENNDRPGELYERYGKTWKLIAYIKPEDKQTGTLTYIDE